MSHSSIEPYFEPFWKCFSTASKKIMHCHQRPHKYLEFFESRWHVLQHIFRLKIHFWFFAPTFILFLDLITFNSYTKKYFKKNLLLIFFLRCGHILILLVTFLLIKVVATLLKKKKKTHQIQISYFPANFN